MGQDRTGRAASAGGEELVGTEWPVAPRWPRENQARAAGAAAAAVLGVSGTVLRAS